MKLPILSAAERNKKFLLYTVLFLSGVTALMYQVIWIRKFGLVFGFHVFSISTVLTAFMAGLAIGSLWFGKLIDRKKNPLKVFFWLEIGIGLFALLFPVLFDGLTRLYAQIAQNLYIEQYYIQLIRFFLSFLFLLIPTILMGGTLPVIIKYVIRDLSRFGDQVSGLYSINNLGAVTGCFIAGFILVINIGLTASLYAGAFLNLLNAAIVYWLYKKYDYTYTGETKPSATASQKPANKQTQLPRYAVKIALWVFAIEGFTTLAYEVLWTRVLVGFSYDKTTYFYTTILISFIFGLSFGSLLIKKYVDRIKDLLGILIIIQVFIGITTAASLIFFSKIAPVLIQQRDLFSTWMETSGKEYFIFFLILSVPTTLMGMTYPVVSKIYSDNIKSMGKKMGKIGFLDTVGSILGSFVAGFILIPFIGVVKSMMLVIFINLALGLLVLLFHPGYSLFKKSRMILVIAAGAFLVIFFKPVNSYFSWWDRLELKDSWFGNHYEEMLFYDEGEDATVMILRYPDEHKRSLMINGHNTAYTSKRDLSVNRQLGYMPYILHPDPENAMVVGFGLGVTAYSLTVPDIKEVDVAEICPGVIKGAPVFAQWNHNVQHHPKVTVFNEDGRSILFMTDKKYDIITSNAIHPRLNNNVYTKDYYEICLDKLSEDGVFCQWIPQNWMSETEYKSLIKAFTEAFPHVSLWYVNEYSTMAVGTHQPLNVSYNQIKNKFENETMYRELEEVGIMGPDWFVAQYWMSDQEVRNWVKEFPSNTDNFPLVEFSKVISIEPNVPVMKELAAMQPNYSRFFNQTNKEELAVLNDLGKFYDFNKNQILSVIEAVYYHRNQRNIKKGTGS